MLFLKNIVISIVSIFWGKNRQIFGITKWGKKPGNNKINKNLVGPPLFGFISLKKREIFALISHLHCFGHLSITAICVSL
jgi:hypothetical protein